MSRKSIKAEISQKFSNIFTLTKLDILAMSNLLGFYLTLFLFKYEEYIFIFEKYQTFLILFCRYEENFKKKNKILATQLPPLSLILPLSIVKTPNTRNPLRPPLRQPEVVDKTHNVIDVPPQRLVWHQQLLDQRVFATNSTTFHSDVSGRHRSILVFKQLLLTFSSFSVSFDAYPLYFDIRYELPTA